MKEDRLIKLVMAGGVFLLCLVMTFTNLWKKRLPEDEKQPPDGLTGAPAEGGSGAAAPPVTEAIDWFPEITEPVTPYSPATPPEQLPTGRPERELPEAWTGIRGAATSVVFDYLTDKTIVLEKGEGYEDAVLTLEELPVYRQLRISIAGVKCDPIRDTDIRRIAQDTCYGGTPPSPTPTATPVPTKPGSGFKPGMQPTPTPTLSPDDPYLAWQNDLVRAISSEEERLDDGTLTQTLVLTLDGVYVCNLYEDEWNYYISLARPKDIYSRILVVDAGHGGNDEGTSSAGRAYLEKTINLNIVRYLKELLDGRTDIRVYYTRLEDTKPSLKQRVTLANDVEADFFLSVHCNANDSKKLHGTEVLYSSLQNGWTGMNSRRFALICLEEMTGQVGLFDRGIVARDHNVTIIRDARVPVALVETAFMSNASDMELLGQEQTQRKIAEALYTAVLKAYDTLAEEKAEEEAAR